MDQSEGSLESKHDLADKAAECLMEFGAVSKFVVVNSAFHEVRLPIYSFSSSSTGHLEYFLSSIGTII